MAIGSGKIVLAALVSLTVWFLVTDANALHVNCRKYVYAPMCRGVASKRFFSNPAVHKEPQIMLTTDTDKTLDSPPPSIEIFEIQTDQTGFDADEGDFSYNVFTSPDEMQKETDQNEKKSYIKNEENTGNRDRNYVHHENNAETKTKEQKYYSLLKRGQEYYRPSDKVGQKYHGPLNKRQQYYSTTDMVGQTHYGPTDKEGYEKNSEKPEKDSKKAKNFKKILDYIYDDDV